MDQQLSELYYVLALAYTSARILILPKMVCSCAPPSGHSNVVHASWLGCTIS